MREIKFRGKDVARVNAFVYGDLYKSVDGVFYIRCPNKSGNFYDDYAVYPDTVGQYTGLLDTEGREIYEGDVVRVVHYGDESIHVIKYCDDMDYPAFDLDPHFDCESNGLSFCECERETTITVIGNVHDNVALLKEVSE